jgi:hypothetical protein
MTALATIADMIREAEKHADDMSKDRVRAVEYYQGVMHDTPSDKGRSKIVSRKVRSVIKKTLPSIARTILGNERIVEYQPVAEGDEAGAEQATDYVNNVIMQECDLYRVIESGIHDALLLRNGILQAYFEEKLDARVTSHTGLPEDAFAQLAAEPDVEVLEHSERMEFVEGQQLPVHDLKIKRMIKKRGVKAAAIPRERFLIHPDAVSLEDSALTGSKTQVRRSDLVAMGYDKDLIWGLPIGDEDDDYERDERRDFVGDAQETHRANDLIDYYDLFVRFDKDEDGIAELRHMCFAGGVGEKNLLMDEEADEVEYVDLRVLSQPHQWEGISLFDDVEDIQRVETVLLRLTLDNLYENGNLQPIVQDGAITNMDAVLNPEFGLPIRVKQGFDVRQAVSHKQAPLFAPQSFAMLEYMDKEAQERTGVTDASSGLAPDALQNMTAKASAMIEAAGIGQAEMMVRTIADGLRKFFRLILKLVVKHQDVPRTVRLRGEWVQYDPRSWNAEMDCTVNTGLGAGTRERDMQIMQVVIGAQEKLLAAFGPDNPYVKPEQIYKSLAGLVQAAGLKSVDQYFTSPDPQEVQAKLEAMKNAPSPEQMKAEAQMQIEQAKAQVTAQLRQMELQADIALENARMSVARDKEMAQMEADLQVERAKIAADELAGQRDRELKAQELAVETTLKREQMALTRELEYAKMGMTTGENGQMVDAQTQALGALMQETRALMQGLAQAAQLSSMPKRVVRDENGDIVGVENVVMQ